MDKYKYLLVMTNEEKEEILKLAKHYNLTFKTYIILKALGKLI